MLNQETREKILGLMRQIPEGELYPLDKARLNSLESDLSNLPIFSGLILRTASHAHVDQDRLPILIVCGRDSERLRVVSGLNETLVVLSPLGRGTASVAGLLAGDQKVLAPGADMVTEVKLPSRTLRVESFDLQERFPLKFAPGMLAVMLIERDWISNVELLEIQDPEAGPGQSQEQLYFLEDALTFADRIRSRQGVPGEAVRYDRDRDSPKLLGEGLQLKIPSQISMEGGHAVVHGAIKLRARPEWIVQSRYRSQAPAEPFVWTPERQQDTPRAIVQATLLFVQGKTTNPRRINLQIPIFADGEPKPGDLVEGAFQVDLPKALTEPLHKDTYWVYFIVGQFVDGPHQIVVQEPD